MLYFIKYTKPTTPIKRHFTKHKLIFFSNKLNFFLKNLKKNGRSFGKNMLSNKKNKLKKIFNYFFNYFFTVYYILNLHFNIKKQYIFLKNKYNNIYILQKTQFLLPGQYIYINYLNQIDFLLIFKEYFWIDKSISIIFSGLFIPLICFIENIYIFNLGYNKEKYAKASGSKCFLISYSKKHSYYTLLLPSKNLIYIPNFWKAIIGISSCFSYHTVLGKYKYNKNMSRGLSVRGVAKNPVDHPHGGRTKVKVPEVSPWNWIAKNSK